jgi:hypothetical protein
MKDRARTVCKLIIAGLVLFILILPMGCATTIEISTPPSYPQSILPTATEIEDVAPYVAPQRLLDCYSKSFYEQKICRDSYLTAILLGEDTQWQAYEGDLFDLSQKASQPSTMETVFKLLGMGLGAAGALSGGSLVPLAAAPYFASAAGILPGVQAAVSSTPDPFFGKTLTTIDALMVAARTGILEEVLTCTILPVDECNLTMAASLGKRYHRAGSIPGALSEANEAAVAKTIQTRERLKTKMLKMEK